MKKVRIEFAGIGELVATGKTAAVCAQAVAGCAQAVARA